LLRIKDGYFNGILVYTIQTKDSLTQLCDDFERSIIKVYPIIDEDNNLSMAAEP